MDEALGVAKGLVEGVGVEDEVVFNFLYIHEDCVVDFRCTFALYIIEKRNYLSRSLLPRRSANCNLLARPRHGKTHAHTLGSDCRPKKSSVLH